VTDQKKGISKGCLIALIIAGAILIVVIAMSVVCYVKRDSIMEWSLITMADKIQSDVTANLPEGIYEEEAKTIIADYKQAVKDKKINPQDMQALAYAYQKIFKDGKIDKDEALSLLNQMKAALGTDTIIIDAVETPASTDSMSTYNDTAQ
jgi:hypothetical protein